MSRRKKVTVYCYSISTGKNLLKLCDGKIDGANTDTCHPKWKKKHCDPDKSCFRYFADGANFRKEKLAKLLKKKVKDLTNYDKWEKADEFRKRAYRKCRRVKITVEG